RLFASASSTATWARSSASRRSATAPRSASWASSACAWPGRDRRSHLRSPGPGLRDHQGAVPGGRPKVKRRPDGQASVERAFWEGLGGVCCVGEQAGLHSGVLPHYLVDLIGTGVEDADAGCAAAIADGADDSL